MLPKGNFHNPGQNDPLVSISAHLWWTSGICVHQTFFFPLGVPAPSPILEVCLGLTPSVPGSGGDGSDQIHLQSIGFGDKQYTANSSQESFQSRAI